MFLLGCFSNMSVRLRVSPRRPTPCAYCITMPPHTGKLAPVTKSAKSLAKNTQALATSSAVAMRSMGVRRACSDGCELGRGTSGSGQIMPGVTIFLSFPRSVRRNDKFISDQVELVSPGHLPNHLTIEQIRYGLSNMRNPLLVLHATHLLPYRGLGSGIPRALNLDSSVDRLLSSLNRYEH